MKAEQKLQEAQKIILELQKNYRKLTRKQVVAQHDKYIDFIRYAAYRGNVEAQYEMALNYEDENYFVPNPRFNPKLRFYWYLKAAKAGHPESSNNLAALYERGEGVKQNFEKALYYYKRAFELGCKYAGANYKLLVKQLKGNVID